MKPDFNKQHNFQSLMVGMFAATGAASAFSAALGVPLDQWMLVTGLMLGTSTVSLLIGYGLYQQKVIRLMRSLHTALLVNGVLIIVILFVNVSAIALSMIITDSQTILITSLLIFAAIVALILGVLHSRLLTQELHLITHAVDQLGEANDLNVRLPLFGNDELANLAESFNKMAERLREADRQKQQAEQLRRDLIAWVSHDLRTPLTSLRVMNEALMDGVISDADQSALYLHEMNREIVALGQLIDDMFELSLLDMGQLKLGFQKTSLRDLLSSMLGSFKARAARHQIRFEMEIQDKTIDPIWIAPDKIQRVLNNLLDNAFQYTESGGEIRICAQRDGADVLVSVFNSGTAIPAADLRHIFEVFYRGDKARRDTHGQQRHAGMGLAIARRFIEAHGGRIWATSDPDQGTAIYFRLPRAERTVFANERD